MTEKLLTGTLSLNTNKLTAQPFGTFSYDMSHVTRKQSSLGHMTWSVTSGYKVRSTYCPAFWLIHLWYEPRHEKTQQFRSHDLIRHLRIQSQEHLLPSLLAHSAMIWATSRENLSSGFCDQVWFKLACSATKASWGLTILDLASVGIILSKQRTTKKLIFVGHIWYKQGLSWLI